MGAVTAIQYAANSSFNISSMVLDSPFTSLLKMVQDVAREHYNLPKFLLNLGISVISGSIRSRLNIDLFQELVPLNASRRCSVNLS